MFNKYSFQFYKNKIYITDSNYGFYIKVFDLNGKPLYSIDKNSEIKNLKVTKEYKNNILNFYKKNRKKLFNMIKDKYIFYNNYPKIYWSYINDNKIYITTYKVMDGKQELIVLDLKGNIINKTFIPVKSSPHNGYISYSTFYTINNDKFYELIENEENETWELHIIPIISDN